MHFHHLSRVITSNMFVTVMTFNYRSNYQSRPTNYKAADPWPSSPRKVRNNAICAQSMVLILFLYAKYEAQYINVWCSGGWRWRQSRVYFEIIDYLFIIETVRNIHSNDFTNYLKSLIRNDWSFSKLNYLV